MFVLFFAATQAIKLTSFDTFTINLNALASEYFVFQGPTDYSYFYQKMVNSNFGFYRMTVMRFIKHPIWRNLYLAGQVIQ